MPCNPKYQSDQWTRANQVWVEGVTDIDFSSAITPGRTCLDIEGVFGQVHQGKQ